MRQIRKGVFETNSSSVHSITMCMADQFEKFRRGEVWYVHDTWQLPEWWEYKEWITPQEVRDLLSRSKEYRGPDPQTLSDDDILDLLKYSVWSYKTVGSGEYETYYDSFTTPSGETVCAFGYYGHD